MLLECKKSKPHLFILKKKKKEEEEEEEEEEDEIQVVHIAGPPYLILSFIYIHMKISYKKLFKDLQMTLNYSKT